VQIKGFTSRERVRGTAISSNAEIFAQKIKLLTESAKKNKKGRRENPCALGQITKFDERSPRLKPALDAIS
jgi:hypothetical protein